MKSVIDEGTATIVSSPVAEETYSGLVAPMLQLLGAVLRFQRGKCSSCHKRRILFEVRISSVGPVWQDPITSTLTASPRVCAVCANIR